MAKADGMNYAPQGKAQPVVAPGAFKFAAARRIMCLRIA